MNTYTLNLKPLTKRITVKHFEQLCQLNPELKLETSHQVEIYRPEKVTEIVNHPITLSGEDILPELVMELDLIWQ